MGQSTTADSRGQVKRTMKRKQKKAVKPQKADIGSKRKAKKLGKRQVEGRAGVAIHYVTRTRALRMLQISLKDFRRLCILKGIYPRAPPKKPIGKRSTAYYSAKDIAFLQHEPILAKFREMKAMAKKIARSLGRKEESEARRLFMRRPRYSLDHVVRERYPTFQSVLADLDDGLTLINLFAHLPLSVASRDHGPRCARIVREWHFYVAKTQALRKSFVSIKGVYYQAEVRGQAITWLVPHKFSTDVQSLQENKEIDFRVMKTFLEFYETLMEFVMFKLYREDLSASYPPTRLKDAEDAGAFLKALRADPLNNEEASRAQAAKDEKAASEPQSKRQKLSKEKAGAAKSLEKVLAETAAKYHRIAKGEGEGEEEEEDDDQDEDDDAAEEFAEADAEAKALLENQRLINEMVNLFKGKRVFLSREVPLESCEFIVESFGGTALREDLGDSPSDPTITHHVTDRPTSAESLLATREYVQPQWLFDCVNAKVLLPCEPYSPLAETLPPHLSPFVDNEAEGYIPSRAKEIEEFKQSRAAGGGTEEYLRSSGMLKEEDKTKAEDEDASSSDEEDDIVSSSDEEEESEEEEEADDEEEDRVEKLKAKDVESEDEEEEEIQEEEEEEAEDEDEKMVPVKAPEPFIPATSFSGAKPGFFFRRGPQGLGYYLDAASAEANEQFDAAKDKKESIKAARKAETTEAKEMRTIMMSKKARHLYERMQYGINKKKEAISSLERKRAEVEQTKSSSSGVKKSKIGN